MANVDTHEEFWGILLSKDKKEFTWDPAADSEEDVEHKIQLTQACLGHKAKQHERNIVEVTTENDEGKKITLPIVSLTVGGKECIHLELGFNNATKFVLKEGSGPVGLSGVHLQALPLDLDDNEDSSDDDEDEEVPELVPVSGGAVIEEIMEVEEAPPKAKGKAAKVEEVKEDAKVAEAPKEAPKAEAPKEEAKEAAKEEKPVEEKPVEEKAGAKKAKKRPAPEEKKETEAPKKKKDEPVKKAAPAEEEDDEDSEDDDEEDESGDEATIDLLDAEAVEDEEDEDSEDEDEPEFGDDVDSDDDELDDDDDEDDEDMDSDELDSDEDDDDEDEDESDEEEEDTKKKPAAKKPVVKGKADKLKPVVNNKKGAVKENGVKKPVENGVKTPAKGKENVNGTKTPKGKENAKTPAKGTPGQPKKTPAELKQFLLKSPNLPKTYDKFVNLMKNNMKVTDGNQTKELWDFVQKNKK